jgi:Holliday junction DNA helicase RuvA
MISLLTGEVAYKSIDHIIVDVGGVGYRLQIPLSTYYALPEEGVVRLHVHTHVREDAIHLFGFLGADEKAMFLLLITISGIGPKLALNILSHIPTDVLRMALAEGDAKRLATLPGIGKKTAERLILELREKVLRTEASSPGPSPAGSGKSQDAPREDVLSALINLGYKENLARKVLETMEISPAAELEEILKGALKVLAK